MASLESDAFDLLIAHCTAENLPDKIFAGYVNDAPNGSGAPDFPYAVVRGLAQVAPRDLMTRTLIQQEQVTVFCVGESPRSAMWMADHVLTALLDQRTPGRSLLRLEGSSGPVPIPDSVPPRFEAVLHFAATSQR